MAEEIAARPGALRESFGWPPFTVLDFANKEWQARKKAWVSLGLRGEVGRGENLIGFSPQLKAGKYGNGDRMRGKVLNTHYVKEDGEEGSSFWVEKGKELNDTSIFDPVLCELVYTWFCPDAGLVLDPFAGGPTRGIVACKLGLGYYGHELRPEQVEANNHCAGETLGLEERDRVDWIQGDSGETMEEWEDEQFDLVMTCPPYFNLEVYSDEPGDISNMSDYEEFLDIYRRILHKAVAKLKNDRFFAIVVSNVRGKTGGGAYYPLVSDTVRIMGIAGLSFYNEAILKKPNGSAQFRARRFFESSRKLVNIHEVLLVFCKGDPKKATAAAGDVNRFVMNDSVEEWL